jgi:hypothetical protein
LFLAQARNCAAWKAQSSPVLSSHSVKPFVVARVRGVSPLAQATNASCRLAHATLG